MSPTGMKGTKDERSSRRASGSGVRGGWIAPAWLALLALVCAAEVATHAGSRNGFLVSSRPQYSLNDALPGEGYVSWAGAVPVLHDADGIFTLVAFWLGERGPADTGILDRRAGYAYLASLAVPWAGEYAGYLVVNWLFWWGAAAAAYWLARRRWSDMSLALVFSFLVATGHGLLFMAGVPMSYLAAYASMLLVLALAERLGAFTARARLGAWLLLGWAAGVASTLYFAHIPIAIFWWVYGARRVAWRYLLAGTAVALAISAAWEVFGRLVVGLGFTTDNSGAIGEAIGAWARHLQTTYVATLTVVRAAPAGGTLLGAFALPWWLLAALGFAASSRDDREWALALGMAGLLPAIVIISLLPMPRAAFYMYPAVYLLAARGALVLGRWGAAGLANLTRWPPSVAGRGYDTAAVEARWRRIATGAMVAAVAGALALVSNVDQLDDHRLNQGFHFSAGGGW